MLSIGQVKRAELEMNALTSRIHETFALRGKSKKALEAWSAATRAFHTYENPVNLLWQEENLAKIRAGDRFVMEGALAFLEAEPHFHRSGYLTEKVLHSLKKAPLDGRDEMRLQNVVLRALNAPYKREFKYYARLIPRLWTAEFEAQLRQFAVSASAQNHVRLTLIALEQARFRQNTGAK